jgi:hypothetical protein
MFAPWARALAQGAVVSDDDIEPPAARTGASGADWGVEDGVKSCRAADLERPAVVFVAAPQARSFPRQQSPARSSRRSVLPGAA